MRKRILLPAAALAIAAVVAPPGAVARAGQTCVEPLAVCVNDPPQLWYCLYGSYRTVLGQEICRLGPDPT